MDVYANEITETQCFPMQEDGFTTVCRGPNSIHVLEQELCYLM